MVCSLWWWLSLSHWLMSVKGEVCRSRGQALPFGSLVSGSCSGLRSCLATNVSVLLFVKHWQSAVHQGCWVDTSDWPNIYSETFELLLALVGESSSFRSFLCCLNWRSRGREQVMLSSFCSDCQASGLRGFLVALTRRAKIAAIREPSSIFLSALHSHLCLQSTIMHQLSNTILPDYLSFFEILQDD